MEVAGPVLLALILTDAAFGVVSRVVPQLNVFAVGFPAKVVVGLLLVTATLPFVAGWIGDELQQDVGHRPPSDPGGVMAGEKTEKATPKKAKEAREKGQVARSTDLQGAVVLMVGIFALGSAGPGLVQRLGDVLRAAIVQTSSPDVVSMQGIGGLMISAGTATLLAVAPIALACMIAGVLASVGMVGFRPSAKALKPDFKRMDPKSGAKNIFGPNALVELAKSLTKVGVVAAIVAVALLPRLPEFGGMVGLSPTDFGTILSADMGSLVKRAAFAYLFIGIADFAWQKKRTAKSMKMDKQEVTRRGTRRRTSRPRCAR